MGKTIYIITIVLCSLCFLAERSDFQRLKKRDTPKNKSQGDFEPIVVLELFTSQGCSSCPSADALLQKVKDDFDKEVYSLSYHVDYWNYIGWKDPFSQSKFTDKQRRYNVKFRHNSNYTPQLVVNGKEHFVGSDAIKMNSIIASYRKVKPENSIKIENVKNEDGRIEMDYTIEGQKAGKHLRIVLVLDERITKVKRGENKNRSLRNSNIVIAEKSIDSVNSKGSAFIEVPEIVGGNEKVILMVLLEKENLDIVGASKVRLGG